MLDLGVRTATECFMATGSYNTYRRRHAVTVYDFGP